MQLISSSVSGHVGALITFSVCLPVRASLGAAINRKSSSVIRIYVVFIPFGFANGVRRRRFSVHPYLRTRGNISIISTRDSIHRQTKGDPHDRRRPSSLHVITRPRTSTVPTPTFRNEFIRSSQSIEPTFVLAAVRADIHIQQSVSPPPAMPTAGPPAASFASLSPDSRVPNNSN